MLGAFWLYPLYFSACSLNDSRIKVEHFPSLIEPAPSGASASKYLRSRLSTRTVGDPGSAGCLKGMPAPPGQSTPQRERLPTCARPSLPVRPARRGKRMGETAARLRPSFYAAAFEFEYEGHRQSVRLPRRLQRPGLGLLFLS